MSLMNTMARFADKKNREYKGPPARKSSYFQDQSEYEWEQKLMCLKWLVYCISYPFPLILDDNLNTLQETADKIVKKMFDDENIKNLIGKWELTWGVGVFQSGSSDVADKTMFLAKYDGKVPGVDSDKVDSYVLSIAGTNMQSNYTLLFENMGIINMEEWEPEIEEYKNMKNCKVADGFALGLDNLQNKTKVKGSDEKIWEKIEELVEEAKKRGKNIGITVVGHSLGGALAQLMGLELVERIYKRNWQKICRIKVSSLGSPSPGNAAWRTYYNNAMNGQYSYPKSDITLHSWNVLDPVPLLATEEGMEKIQDMYKDPEVSNHNIDDTFILDRVIGRVFKILKNKGYKHLIDREGFPSEFNRHLQKYSNVYPNYL